MNNETIAALQEFDALIAEGINSEHFPLTDSVWEGSANEAGNSLRSSEKGKFQMNKGSTLRGCSMAVEIARIIEIAYGKWPNWDNHRLQAEAS